MSMCSPPSYSLVIIWILLNTTNINNLGGVLRHAPVVYRNGSGDVYVDIRQD
jgi:hypothetical protein